MDSKELQLYHEELRANTIKLNEAVEYLLHLSEQQLEKYEKPPKEVEVSGKVQVNTEKEVAVSNLADVVDQLKAIGEDFVESIEKNAHEPLESVTVKNIADAKSESVTIKNIDDLKDYFADLEKAIENKEPVVVEKQELKLPNSASDYISVRLTDGKKFYKAIDKLASTIIKLPTVISTVTGDRVLAVANADGTAISGGASTPTDGAFDFMDGNDLQFMDGTSADFMSG